MALDIGKTCLICRCRLTTDSVAVTEIGYMCVSCADAEGFDY
jgi:hypothetical protein